MKKILIAGVAALAIAGSTAVYAQHRHHHPERLSAADRSAFIDARIAAVRAGLQLTPDQDKLWPPLETAVRDFAKQRMDRANARASERDARRAEREQQRSESRGPQDRSARVQDRDPVARLRERADTMASTADGLKRIADAADPLYKSLDDGQKRRLMVLSKMGGRHGGWRELGFDRGFGGGPGQDGERGPGRDRGPERL